MAPANTAGPEGWERGADRGQTPSEKPTVASPESSPGLTLGAVAWLPSASTGQWRRQGCLKPSRTWVPSPEERLHLSRKLASGPLRGLIPPAHERSHEFIQNEAVWS